MSTHIDKVFTKAVSPSSTETSTKSISNGTDVFITRIEGSAIYDPDVKVELKFGSDVLFVTHGTLVSQVPQLITGDGTKELTIILTNDGSTTETLMLGYVAVEHT